VHRRSPEILHADRSTGRFEQELHAAGTEIVIEEFSSLGKKPPFLRCATA
jgi:hypothetical protein